MGRFAAFFWGYGEYSAVTPFPEAGMIRCDNPAIVPLTFVNCHNHQRWF